MSGVMVERSLAGLEYLNAVSELLQAARLRSPFGGIWEAADLQWWWRRDQHADTDAATFWYVDDAPVAAAVITDWGDRLGCDVLRVDDTSVELLQSAWQRILEHLAVRPGIAAEVAIRIDDPATLALATAAGFEPTEEVGVGTLMDVRARPPVSPLPSGLRILDRDELADRPHHMISRSGPDVARHLASCSLYRPELDLVVLDEHDDIAGYGLFWADPVTGVGMVEPMRTEDAFQGRGVARGVLTEGLARLAAAGCRTLKVSYMADNPVSRGLYLSAGFVAVETSRTYRR